LSLEGQNSVTFGLRASVSVGSRDDRRLTPMRAVVTNVLMTWAMVSTEDEVVTLCSAFI
jgi:hypothetical protein